MEEEGKKATMLLPRQRRRAGRAAFVAFGWRWRLADGTKTRVKTSRGFVLVIQASLSTNL